MKDICLSRGLGDVYKRQGKITDHRLWRIIDSCAEVNNKLADITLRYAEVLYEDKNSLMVALPRTGASMNMMTLRIKYKSRKKNVIGIRESEDDINVIMRWDDEEKIERFLGYIKEILEPKEIRILHPGYVAISLSNNKKDDFINTTKNYLARKM